MSNLSLIPERECGECSVCCNVVSIDDPDLVKLPRIDCANLRPEGGCSIHKTRPEICRNWFCMWRYLPQLNDDWRPDKKGIMVRSTSDDVPDEYADKVAFEFVITGDDGVKNDPGLIDFLGAFISQGYPCFLSIGKPGHTATKTLLNDMLLPAVRMKNLPLFKQELSAAFEQCRSHPKRKMAITDGKIVVMPEEDQ